MMSAATGRRHASISRATATIDVEAIERNCARLAAELTGGEAGAGALDRLDVDRRGRPFDGV